MEPGMCFVLCFEFLRVLFCFVCLMSEVGRKETELILPWTLLFPFCRQELSNHLPDFITAVNASRHFTGSLSLISVPTCDSFPWYMVWAAQASCPGNSHLTLRPHTPTLYHLVPCKSAHNRAFDGKSEVGTDLAIFIKNKISDTVACLEVKGSLLFGIFAQKHYEVLGTL